MEENGTGAENNIMLEEPVESVIPKLAVPAIISMLITAVYNMADTFFVSQLGTSASGAVGIIFSAMAMIQAVSFMIGMGAGSNMARILGAGKEDEAKKYASTAWFTGFGAGCFIAVLGLLNIHKLVMFLGSTDTIAPYAEAYAKYIFMAAPFMMCSFIMNNLLRFQGLAVYAMCGITAGGILNMALDPLFIFRFQMGTAGAGLATGLSQLLSFCILFYMCRKKSRNAKISIKDFKPALKIYGDIIYTGAPSLARQGIVSASTVVVNSIARTYGDPAIAAMSIVSRFCMFINSVVIGFGQGFQPVCSFSFGAGRYDRVKRAYWFCVKVSTVLLLVLSAAAMVFSGNIISLFRKDDLEVIAIGTFALRAQLCTLPIWGIYTMSNMFSQSIGYGIRATILSCSRQGFILIPLLMILPKISGLTGLQIAQPVSDALATVLALVLVTGIMRELENKDKN